MERTFFLALSLLAAAEVNVASLPRADARPTPTGDYVVLLHGLARTPRAMQRMARHLENAGFQVVNLDYPSRHATVDVLAGFLERRVEERCSDATKRVHFVTHSLGGIVVRQMLAAHADRRAAGADVQTARALDRIGRIVMLAPPNGGSPLVDRFRRLWPYRWVTGPAGLQLGTGPAGVPGTLGTAPAEVGVIAGDRTCNPFYSALIRGSDDGKVAVPDTALAGMADFLVVHATHTFIMRNREVLRQTAAFLQSGRFAHADRDTATR